MLNRAAFDPQWFGIIIFRRCNGLTDVKFRNSRICTREKDDIIRTCLSEKLDVNVNAGAAY
jgi:hypothetical protein